MKRKLYRSLEYLQSGGGTFSIDEMMENLSNYKEISASQFAQEIASAEGFKNAPRNNFVKVVANSFVERFGSSIPVDWGKNR